jgi:U3 small nucleolar RNA-associated protein 20
VFKRDRFLIKLPAPGSDRFVLEDAGPAAGDRYKKAKYGDDETSDAGDGGPAATGIAALAGSAEDVPPNFEILVVFALGLLRAMLRKMSGEKGVGGKAGDERTDDAAEEADLAGDASPRGLSKQRRAILEGVVPLMARCLSSPHAAVPPLATRCLAQLSTMRLGAFDASTGALARRIMALLRECPRPGDPLAQDCMKLLNNLLKRHGNFTPTEAQFRFLVTFCFGDLEADQGEAHRSTTFALMRAVLARRPLLPEVYDVMKTVSSLVVRAGAAETRALCSQALVQFLLDYPLGERRLRQHIDLIAANLEYVYASGRQSALRCVRDLSVRFPKDVVAHHAPFLFVPLVARLGADEDAACRKGAGEALHALLKRVGSERSEKDGEFGDASNDGVVKKLLSLCVGWLNVAADGKDSDATSDPRLARAAMQTLGIATSASPRAAASATRAARRRVVALMEAHDPSHGANERDDDDVAVGWQTAYHALLLVEKMSASCPKALESESNVDDAFAAVSKTPFGKAEDARLDHPDAPWRAAQALLQHRHQWVQQAAARVVGRYLAAHGAAMAREMTSLTGAKSKADDDASRETSFLARPVSLETVARASVAVLEQGAGAGAAELDEGLAEQTVKNLTFASAVLLRAAPSDADAASQDAEDASISSSDDEIDDAEDGTSLANGRETSVVGRDGDASKETRVKRPPLPWLFRRVGKVGAGGVGAARAGALKFTAALGSGLGATGFKRNPSVAAPLLLPAALCVDDAVKGVDEAHRDLAAQVLEVLRDAMPGDLFSRASAETRARIVGRRDARRKRKALEAVTDPERAARAKIVKSQKRAAARKRRVGEFRAGKGSGPEGAKKRARDV